jgi:hypothetical protein
MALEDFFDSEVGIAVAATAVVLSPRMRALLRRGAVYGLATAMKATDSVSTAARGVAGEVQQTAASAVQEAQAASTDAKTTARGGRASRTTPAE